MPAESQKKKGVKKGTPYYMRAIHRVLGYFTVGLVLVYAFSGVVLIHRGGDFLKNEVAKEELLQPALSAGEVGKALKLRNFEVTEEDENTLVFANGIYDKRSGQAKYTVKEYPSPIGKLVKLHKLSDAQDRHIAWATTTFGVCLLLLAVTSLFMYKPGTKLFGRNMFYTALGMVIAFILVVLM